MAAVEQSEWEPEASSELRAGRHSPAVGEDELSECANIMAEPAADEEETEDEVEVGFFKPASTEMATLTSMPSLYSFTECRVIAQTAELQVEGFREHRLDRSDDSLRERTPNTK